MRTVFQVIGGATIGAILMMALYALEAMAGL